MKLFTGILLFFIFIFLSSFPGFSQETTATLSGHITDDRGAFLSGATIVMKHEPTGTVTNTQTNSKGIFYLPNLRVGGPYTITITYIGFKDVTLNDVNLALGTNPNLDLNLQSATKDLTEVVVTSSRRAAT